LRHQIAVGEKPLAPRKIIPTLSLKFKFGEQHMLALKSVSFALLGASVLALSACGGSSETTSTESPAQASQTQAVTLAEIVAHPRRADDAARDKFRNPVPTLEFFGVQPDMNVGEVWGGWYTPIIAPYLASGGGTYTAILYQEEGSERAQKRNQAFKDKFVGADGMGNIEITSFGKNDTPINVAEPLDMILTFRNVHNWMGGGYADKAFADFYAALKPGGILGVVEHRLPESSTQDPKGRSGYVQESYMKDLAARAGFDFVGSSEVNSNPRDTADHPMGVWTLPPRSATPKEGSPEAKDFDASLYKNIGESDRATLMFRKPL
jgi:predicted methyltransferase